MGGVPIVWLTVAAKRQNAPHQELTAGEFSHIVELRHALARSGADLALRLGIPIREGCHSEAVHDSPIDLEEQSMGIDTED